MGLCDSCKNGEHNKHTGHYPVKFRKEGKSGMGAKGRSADCDCSVCVRRSTPIVEQSEPTARLIWPKRAYTADPCLVCKDPSHWDIKLPGLLQDGDHPKFGTVNGVNFCQGCPRCSDRLMTMDATRVVA